MNKIIPLLALTLSVVSSTALHAYDDNYRQGSVSKTKKAWGVPAKQPGGLILNDMFYDKGSDIAVLSFLGEPDRDAVMVGGKAFWASDSGKTLKSQGFKDWVYAYGYKDKEYGVFSCADGKWYRNVVHYMTAHGIK